MATLLAQARSASVQASSPPAQVKAAVAQISDRDWDCEKKTLCSTIRVIRRLNGLVAVKGCGICIYKVIMTENKGSFLK